MVTIEIINWFLTIVSVYLLSINNKFGWILSILGCITIGYIYVEKELYYLSGIQVIFLLQSLLGYFVWCNLVEHKILKGAVIYSTIVYFLIASFFMHSVKHSCLGFIDFIIMFIAFIANSLLVINNKYAWYLWLLFDIISCVLCVYLGLNITALLFIILALICIKTIYNKYEKI